MKKLILGGTPITGAIAALFCGSFAFASAEGPTTPLKTDGGAVISIASEQGVEIMVSQPEEGRFLRSMQAPDLVNLASLGKLPIGDIVDFRDGQETCQEMQGFGFAVTESTAINLQKLQKDIRHKAIEALVSRDKGAGFNYIVLPLSSTDFNDTTRGDFSVCDCQGTPDPAKSCFNPSRLKDKIEILREMTALNPEVKLMLKPWTTPPYMKVRSSIKSPNPYFGGKFDPKWTNSYATCLADAAKYVENQGLKIQSISAQNEPGLDLWYPSVVFDDVDHARLLDRLNALLAERGLSPQLIVRADNFIAAPGAKSTLENMNPKPRRPVFAAHCYSEDPWSAKVLLEGGKERFCSTEANGEIEFMMGECTASGIPDKKGDFNWWMEKRVFADIDMGATGIMAWNGVLDDAYGPRNNGCEKCRGLLTTAWSQGPKAVNVNPEMQALAHVSKFVLPRAKRLLPKTDTKSVQTLAFVNPDGSQVSILRNEQVTPTKIQVVTSKSKVLSLEVPAKSVMTVKVPKHQ